MHGRRNSDVGQEITDLELSAGIWMQPTPPPPWER